MLSRLRLLIVEDVFLIALDIQRVLEGANAGQIVFARNFTEVSALADRLHEFDLAIVNPPDPANLEIVTKLVAAGAAIVVCTAARMDLSGTPLAGAPLVVKPFSDDELLAACRKAIEDRPLEPLAGDLG
jgi:DNA-binding response OmpR family regulator